MTSAPPPTYPPPAGDLPPGPVPPPPPGPVPRPPLQRSRTNKVIGGVSGGLAEYTGIDALLWRIGFVAVTLAWGVGLIVYPLLWILMPGGPVDPAAQSARAADRAARRSGPRSPVPGITLAALLIVAGITALVARFTDLDVSGHVVLGSALVVVGIGLVVAALTGAGRGARGGLVVLGIVLAMGSLISTSVDLDHRPRGPIGDQTFRPATVAAVQDRYEGGVGDLDLDLTRIDPATIDQPVRIAVQHGVGDVDITVPEDADVHVSGDGGIGDIEFEGETIDRQGSLHPGTGTGDWVDDGRAEFRITLSNGIGDVEVSRG